MCRAAQYIYNNVIYTQYLQTFNTQRLLISQGNNTGHSQNALQHLSSLLFLPSGLILCCSTNKQAWIWSNVLLHKSACVQPISSIQEQEWHGVLDSMHPVQDVADVRYMCICLMRHNELNMAGPGLLKSFKDKGKKYDKSFWTKQTSNLWEW